MFRWPSRPWEWRFRRRWPDGRSAYNLVIFAGVFVVQWGIGLLIDGVRALGLGDVAAYQTAVGVYLACCVAAYGYFLWAKPHNQGS